jgi:hypothetical protein
LAHQAPEHTPTWADREIRLTDAVAWRRRRLAAGYDRRVAKSRPSGQPKATRWEILGARLRIWTPPRDVEIPPISRRAVALSITALILAALVVVTLIAPVLDRSKERTAAQQRQARTAFMKGERARLIADQRAQRGRSHAAERLHAAGRDAAARAALLADARAHVGRDVRARVASGDLAGPIRDVRCHYRSDDAGPRVHVDCLAITSPLARHRAATVYTGHPFVVAGSLQDGRYAWCKRNPPPGEGMSGRGASVPLPAVCTR